MKEVLLAFFASLRAGFRSRAALQLEILALRHQVAIYQRRPARARIKIADRLLWAWLSRTWTGWRQVLVFVQPNTVHRLAAPQFSRPLGSPLPHKARQTQAGQGGPGPHPEDVEREPALGLSAHRRELAKLGIHVAKATIGRYMVRMNRPPSPTWRAFLESHLKDLVTEAFPSERRT